MIFIVSFGRVQKGSNSISVRAKRVLYSNRSRYSRGDRGEGGIHGWLGGQDVEMMVAKVS